jgi:hypothetical protein
MHSGGATCVRKERARTGIMALLAAPQRKAMPQQFRRPARATKTVPKHRQDLGTFGIQPKLTIGAPDDKLEREADQVADRVMRTPDRTPLVQRVCAECDEGKTEDGKLRMKGIPAPVRLQQTPSAGFAEQLEQARSAGAQPLPSSVRSFMEQRFAADFGNVRVHADARAERLNREIGARAFTRGPDIFFRSGEFRPHAVEGRRLIAHELAHTVQSQNGRVRNHIQRRRVPGSAELGAAVPPVADVPGLVAARTGLATVLGRAWAGLSGPDQASVKTAAAGIGIHFTNEADLLARLSTLSRPKLLSFAHLIRTTDPSSELGDPALIDIAARPGTSDAANIATLVASANGVFTTIASGARDLDIAQVFGTANVALVKAKYANAKSTMNPLAAANKILTDRSGFTAQVSLGGLSNSAQIAVAPHVIDNPGLPESVVILIHESMHAGNAGLEDRGYIGTISPAAFLGLSEADKLINAAHYEVVPRRIVGAAFDFAGQTFIPAGSAVGGPPALTSREQAIHDASEEFRFAWTASLNLHKLFVRLFKNPGEWDTLPLSANFSGAAAGIHFKDALPFWSKVELLTMHKRLPTINPAGALSKMPVTLIDIALSEGLIRKLATGLFSVPRTDADAVALENSKATPAERAAAGASVDAEKRLLVKLVLRTRVGRITGPTARDIRVVARLARAARAVNFTDFLRARSPAGFT